MIFQRKEHIQVQSSDNLLRTINIFNIIVITSLVVVIGPTCLLGGDGHNNQQLPVNPIEGRIIFEEKGCINCHAIDGFGGDIGPDLVREKYYGSFFDLAARMLNHAPQMAIRVDLLEQKWPTLTDDETDQLISYLFYLRYLGEPGNIAKGKKLILSKGYVTRRSFQALMRLQNR